MGYMAYYELNIDYIIENYCVNKEQPQLQCNGKCHLATQLATNTDSSEDTSYLISLFESFVPVYFQTNKPFSFYKKEKAIVLNNWSYYKSHKSVFIDQLDPPPQV